MPRCVTRSALRAYVLETADPGAVLRMLDRNIQYFDPDAMATVLYGLYTPETGEFTFSAAVMRNLVGSAPARDDIALLTLHRHPAPRQPGKEPRQPG